MKTIHNIILLLGISCLMIAQSTINYDNSITNNELKLNGKTYISISSSGGQVFLEDYQGDNFGIQLQNAINALPSNGGIINCRGVIGDQYLHETVSIDKPVRILLGLYTLSLIPNPDITGHTVENKNMFNINTSGVDIIGLGRSVKGSIRTGKTILKMPYSAGNTLNGYHIYNRGNSCITIKDLDMEGIRTSLGYQYNHTDISKRINGAGGIYMEKAMPNKTASGNVVSQIILDGLYIENTKAHGIYLDGPMLSSINNVRISGAGGHGIFISKGTTCSINSTYVSSANYAGFVIYGHSYATISNSAAENCTLGWWIRGSHNISLFNPATEETNNLGYPWEGLLLESIDYKGDLFEINDVNSAYVNDFVGHGFLISGGDYIQLFNPYCKDPGSSDNYAEQTNTTRFLKITENNKYSVVLNLKSKLSDDLKNRYDVEIADQVQFLTLEWNPETAGTVQPTDAGIYITNNTNKKAPLYLNTDSTNTNIVKCGTYLFTPFTHKY